MSENSTEKIASFLQERPPRQVLRIFRSAVHPDDLAEVARLFEEDIRPVFTSMEGCLSIELVMDNKLSSTGLVEGAVVSRWRSVQEMERAVGTEKAIASQQNVRRLLRSQPIVTVHLVVA